MRRTSRSRNNSRRAKSKRITTRSSAATRAAPAPKSTPPSRGIRRTANAWPCATTVPGRAAHTSYRILERLYAATLMEAQIHTGRTHQVRVHFQFIGHPLVGDDTYGAKQNARLKELTNYAAPRVMLHSRELAFIHPRRKTVDNVLKRRCRGISKRRKITGGLDPPLLCRYIRCMTETLTIRLPKSLARDFRAKTRAAKTNPTEVLRKAEWQLSVSAMMRRRATAHGGNSVSRPRRNIEGNGDI